MKILEKIIPGEKPVEIQEVNSYHLMLACVASGSYMCMLPDSVLRLLQLPEGLTLLPVGKAVTQMIWRKDFSSPAMENCKRILEQTSNLSDSFFS